MSDFDDDLSPDARAVLRHAKAPSAVPDEARERLRTRLSQSLGPAMAEQAQAALKPAQTHAATTAIAPAAAGLSGFAKGTMLGIAIGAAVGAGFEHARLGGEPSPAPHPEVVQDARMPAGEADAGALTEGAPVEVSAPAFPPRGAAAPPKPAAGMGPEQERTVLETARQALVRSDLASARQWLAEHRRRFPSGALSEERDSLAVRASIVAHERAQAQALLEEFSNKYPQSLFAPSLRRAVAAMSESP